MTNGQPTNTALLRARMIDITGEIAVIRRQIEEVMKTAAAEDWSTDKYQGRTKGLRERLESLGAEAQRIRAQIAGSK